MLSFTRFDLLVRFITLLVALLGVVAVAGAQETISTDRPGQATTPAVIDPGRLQFELGFQSTMDDPDSSSTITLSLPIAVARLGVLPAMELRAGIEYRSISVEGVDHSNSGVTGISIGTKVGIAKANGALPELALVAQLGLPAGSEGFRPASVAPTVTLTSRSPLNDAETVNLYTNLSGSWDGSNGTGTGGYAVALWGVPVGSLSVFGEVYGSFPPGLPPVHAVDLGAALPVGSDFQVDLSGGVGITGNAPDAFINLGFSFRIPR